MAATTKTMACGKCGGEFEMHDIFWTHQVCPACLTPHWVAKDGTSRPDGFYDAAGKAAIQANITRNGGRYVPQF